jgi:hypothetical protein
MKKVKNIEPKGLRVLLEVVSTEEKVGNLYVKTFSTNQVLGKILEVGKEILDRKLGLKKDDIIIFKVSESSRVDLGDRRDIRIVNYYDVLALVELEEEDKVVSANFEDDKNNVDISKNIGNGLLNDNIESRQKTLGLIED